MGLSLTAQISAAGMYSLGYNWPVGFNFSSLDFAIGSMVAYENDLVRGSHGYITSTTFNSGFTSEVYANAGTISGNQWENIFSYDDGSTGLMPVGKEFVYNDGTLDTLFYLETYDPTTSTYTPDEKLRLGWQGGVLKRLTSEYYDGTNWQNGGYSGLHYISGVLRFDTSYTSTGAVDHLAEYFYSGSQLDSIVGEEFNTTTMQFEKTQRMDMTYTNGVVTKIDQYGYDQATGSPQYEISFLFGGGSSVGLTEIEEPLLLYPNPAQDFVHLPEGTERAVVFDLTGKRYGKLKLSGNTLDVSSLPSGMYLVSLDGERIARIVKK